MKGTTAITMSRLTIAALVFFSGGDQVWAQQEHGHESPHGGEVRTMGDNHVEFLVIEGKDNKGQIIIYLLDKSLKPLPVDKVEGVVYLTLPDRSKQTLKLVATTEMLKSGHDEDEDHAEGESHKESEIEGEHGGLDPKDISHFQVEVNLNGVDTFDAVVSLKMGDKRNNLRFKYVRVRPLSSFLPWSLAQQKPPLRWANLSEGKPAVQA